MCVLCYGGIRISTRYVCPLSDPQSLGIIRFQIRIQVLKGIFSDILQKKIFVFSSYFQNFGVVCANRNKVQAKVLKKSSVLGAGNTFFSVYLLSIF